MLHVHVFDDSCPSPQAKQLGIEIINEDEFLNLIRKRPSRSTPTAPSKNSKKGGISKSVKSPAAGKTGSKSVSPVCESQNQSQSTPNRNGTGASQSVSQSQYGNEPLTSPYSQSGNEPSYSQSTPTRKPTAVKG